MLRVRWENAFNAIMVPATAGVVTTLIIFGLLISFLYPAQVRRLQRRADHALHARGIAIHSLRIVDGASHAESLVVEAYVGADGRVQDYRILSAPENAQAILPELKNMLIFTTFHPATAFGQPTASRVILSFSKIQVKG